MYDVSRMICYQRLHGTIIAHVLSKLDTLISRSVTASNFFLAFCYLEGTRDPLGSMNTVTSNVESVAWTRLRAFLLLFFCNIKSKMARGGR